MSMIGRVMRNAEHLLFIKNRILTSAIANEGVCFSKKVETPLPPKRPLTAYMHFVKDQRKEILKENPALSSPQQIKLLAAQWGKLTLENRKPYELQARESTLVYGEEHKKYYENLSEQQKEELAKQKSDKRKARRMYRLNRALRESGLPKSAASAYAFFIQSLANKDKSNIKQSTDFIKNFAKKWMFASEDSNNKNFENNFLKDAAEQWKSLSEEEKKLLEKQAAADKVRYSTEMAAWKERLMKEGKDKLLKEYTELKPRGKSALSIETEVITKATKTKKSTKKSKSAKQVQLS